MCDGKVYAFTFLLGFQNYQIVHLEMINILLDICGKKWHGRSISIHCDNHAVVYVLNLCCTQDLNHAAITRNAAMFTAEMDIDPKIVHITGKDNTVAYLSSLDLSISLVFLWVLSTTLHYNNLLTHSWGHGGRVVTLSPPTSAAGVRSPSWP